MSVGCTRGASPMMLTVAAVASFTVPSPGLIDPTPKVSIEVSDVPQTTGVPARSPHADAAACVTLPTTAVAATIGGSVRGSQLTAAHNGADHPSAATSNNSVPTASVRSVSQVLVRRERNQSFAT